MKKFEKLLQKFHDMRVIVLGDVMLDSYQWGRVQRISPEAPVPVIEINKEEYRLGGAANVALNLTALGASVFPIGILGNDANGKVLKKLFAQHRLDTSGLVVDKNRRTTIKTRIGAANQQIVRIDIEHTAYIDDALQESIVQLLKASLPKTDVLIIEDYNKGLLSPELIKITLELCKSYKVPVAVDPKQKNFFAYQAVEIFKPNYVEMQSNLGVRFETDAEFLEAAKKLRKKMRLKYLVVTRGSKGMFIVPSKGDIRHLPSYAREVYDVSGAGDTVISVLSLAYAAKADIDVSATLANHAAGVVCGKLGTAVASPKEIMESIDAAR
jgi:rfaE bifunctional protein kinase chain/domain